MGRMMGWWKGGLAIGGATELLWRRGVGWEGCGTGFGGGIIKADGLRSRLSILVEGGTASRRCGGIGMMVWAGRGGRGKSFMMRIRCCMGAGSGGIRMGSLRAIKCGCMG